MDDKFEWLITYRIKKTHMIILPSWARVLQWIAGNGGKCSSIVISRQPRKERANER